MTQRERLTHEQHNENDIRQELKRLLALSVCGKMRKMGYNVQVEEIEEYC